MKLTPNLVQQSIPYLCFKLKPNMEIPQAGHKHCLEASFLINLPVQIPILPSSCSSSHLAWVMSCPAPSAAFSPVTLSSASGSQKLLPCCPFLLFPINLTFLFTLLEAQSLRKRIKLKLLPNNNNFGGAEVAERFACLQHKVVWRHYGFSELVFLKLGVASRSGAFPLSASLI